MPLNKHTITRFTALCLMAALPTVAAAQQDPPAPGDESQLIAVIQSAAPLFEKAKACQRLGTVGTKDAVGALASLLADPQLSHYARTGLEPIPDSAVDDALREALSRLEGGLLVGTINSIGMRRDAKAAPQLVELVDSSDREVATAAAAALGRIATPEAIAKLRALLDGEAGMRTAVGDACLTAADMLVAGGDETTESVSLYEAMLEAELPTHQKIAALHGAVRARGADGLPLLVELLGDEDRGRFAVALRMAHELDGDEVKDALVDALDKLPSSRRALVIYVLGDRGDRAALPVVLEAAKSSDLELRIPAVRVLATLGDASAVAVLLEAAAGTNEVLASSAKDSLAELPGDDVDAELARRLPESAGAQRLVLIDLLGQRGIAAAVPTLLQLADDEDPALRRAAMAALGLTVGPYDMPALVDQLVQPKTPDDAAAAKAALAKAVLRMPDRDACAAELLKSMAVAPAAAKGELLSLLGVVGGAKALEGVSAAARDADDAVQDAATRVLGEWMSPDAAPKLLELAKTLDEEKYKIRALRGYIRIPRQFGLPEDDRLKMCRNALAVAQRDAERGLVLDALTRIPSKETLDIVLSYLDNEALKDESCDAAVSIAEKLLQSDRATVAEAMQKVVDAGPTGETAVQARLLLRRSKR